jgi:hypothetical protein
VAHVDHLETASGRRMEGQGALSGSIESALASAQPAPAPGAALGGPAVLERAIFPEVGRRGRNVRPRRAAPVASTGGAGPPGGEATPRTRRPVLGLVDAQGPALEVAAVHGRDAFLGRVVVLELHEGEAPRSARFAIGGQLGVDDLAHLLECLDELVAGDVEAQVADEDLVRNVCSLLASGRVLPDRKKEPSRKPDPCLGGYHSRSSEVASR